MDFLRMHFEALNEEANSEEPKEYPFDTQLYLNDIPNAHDHPPTFLQKAGVAGVVRVRQQRTVPISRKVTVNGKSMLLWRVGNEVFASSFICPHQAADLALGDIEDLRADCRGVNIVCPLHKWKFDAENGRCVNHHDDKAVLTLYKTMVDGTGRVFILFPRFDHSLFSSQDSLEDF